MELMEIATNAGKVLALGASIIAIGYKFYKWAYGKGVKEGRRDLTYSRDCQILENVYAPLISLLLDVHMTSCTFIRYGAFRQRIKHAAEIFQERRNLKSKMKGSFAALFDRGISKPTVGIEHGPSFPISQIGEIIKKQAHLAPPELIGLYQQTVREEYEQGNESDDLLSEYHLQLAEHIFTQHEFFASRARFTE